MSGVNLNNTEARFAGTTCGGGKRGNDVLNAIDRKRSRHRIAISERQRARRNDIAPTPFALRNRSVACPRRVSARLATGMRQLHPSHASLRMNKPDDSSQRLHLIIHPDAQVLRTDPALGKNGRCFGKHQSSTAYCPAAQMHEMPVAHVPVRAAVLAHRRNKYAVRKRNIPNRERIKQVSHRVYAAFLNSKQLRLLSGQVVSCRSIRRGRFPSCVRLVWKPVLSRDAETPVLSDYPGPIAGDSLAFLLSGTEYRL